MIPSEVLQEAGGFPDIETLRQYEYATTPSVLRWLAKVMVTIPQNDKDLVNLYANRGGADPLMVACALDGEARESSYLDPAAWVIVTGDKAVQGKAHEFALRVLNLAEFATLIDEAQGR